MIEVRNLNKTYERARPGDNRVLKDVSFTLPETGFVCILGPSGCGKTSLLNAIGGLDRFDNGKLSTGDICVSRYGTAAYETQRNKNFGYIFQNYYLLENHSAAYNVYLGLHSLDLSHKEKLRRVRMALHAVDMDRFIRRKVSELSGGQQQRIAIARALARRPRVIFADEPTGNLDEANTRNICTLLRQASRESLVIMVTHEERIANFFADRIIRLDQGVIASDSESWERGGLSLDSDKELYAGDFQEETMGQEQVSLRLLRTPDAPPVNLTVVAAKDQIIIKLSDSRSALLSTDREPPTLLEGPRPVLSLESVDQSVGSQSQLFREPPAPQCKAGKGLTPRMLVQESRQLMKGKGLRHVGTRIFLALLTILTLLTVSDFITISKVDPQDFITADSHILTIKLTPGSECPEDTPPAGYYTWNDYYTAQYIDHIAKAQSDFDFLPIQASSPKYTIALFFQMGKAAQVMPAFSAVPIHRLDPQTLLCGKMPETSEQVVIDRILLDAILEKDGIVQNSIQDYSSFLGEVLNYGSKGLNPMIVGVSDSGERSIYAMESTLYTLGAKGVSLITLSELQHRFPGQYDLLESPNPMGSTLPPISFRPGDMEDSDCIVNLAQAGAIWAYRLGQSYSAAPNDKIVQACFTNPELSARIIVTDNALKQMIRNNYSDVIQIWCADKAAMLTYLSQPTDMEQQNQLQVQIRDIYAEKYSQYQQAATIRADARTIVTATILVLSMVMLYLLCRTQVNQRLGLIAVYRLLGIPGRKLHGIFLLEGALSGATTVLPATALTWLVIALSGKIPELEASLELPWQAATLSALGILLYYLLVVLLPLARLLRLPPAQLAAKYDM